MGITHLEQWLLLSRSFKDGISDLLEMPSYHKKKFFVWATAMLGRHSSSKWCILKQTFDRFMISLLLTVALWERHFLRCSSRPWIGLINGTVSGANFVAFSPRPCTRRLKIEICISWGTLCRWVMPKRFLRRPSNDPPLKYLHLIVEMVETWKYPMDDRHSSYQRGNVCLPDLPHFIDVWDLVLHCACRNA